VERKGTADVIGYCGLSFHGNGSPGEPELAYELLRAAHGCGYATEAKRSGGDGRDWDDRTRGSRLSADRGVVAGEAGALVEPAGSCLVAASPFEP